MVVGAEMFNVHGGACGNIRIYHYDLISLPRVFFYFSCMATIEVGIIYDQIV